MSDTLLNARLGELRKRTLNVGWGKAAARAVTIILVAMMVSIWADAAVDLPPQLRIAATALAAAAGLFGLGWVMRDTIRSLARSRLARTLDAHLSAAGQIVTGIDLMDDGTIRAGLGAGLAELAVQRASDRAAGVTPHEIVSSRPAWMSASMLTGVCCSAAAIAIMLPGLAKTEFLRFADPFGDHPPYSRLILHVEPGNASVVYGDGFDVTVRTEGMPAERVELVLEPADGSPADAVPMFPEQNGHWRTTIANVTAPGRYFARSRGTRSRRFDLHVITVPRIQEVRMRITPLQYTNLPPYEGPVPEGGIKGLKHTRVEIVAASNRPLSEGNITIRSQGAAKSFSMAPAAARTSVSGVFEIAESGTLEISISDVEGTHLRDPFLAQVTLLKDERPMVRLLEPRQMSLATPNVSLPIVVGAEDDYGISRVELFRGLNDSRPIPITLAEPVAPTPIHDATHSLPLASYGLQPGDVIKLFARAEDNDPDGSKGAESTIAEVHIISVPDYQRMMLSQQGMEVLQSKYQQAQRRMEALQEEIDRLSKELEKAAPGSEVDKKLRKKLEELARQMAKDAAEIKEQAENKLPFDVDQALSKQLEELAKALEESSKQCKGMAGQPKLSTEDARKKLDEMKKALKRNREQFDEEAMKPMEHLAKVFPLMEDEGRFVALYQRQRDLAERMESLRGEKDTDNPATRARMREFEEEQAKLREELRAVIDDIEAHVEQLPDDPRLDDMRKTAKDFADALRKSDAERQMSDAESALGERACDRGADSAKAAADTLEQFLGKCKGMGEKGGQCLKFQPKLAACLGDTVKQMQNAMGMGQGNAMGNGYSVSQNTMQNMGLYGNLPTMGQTSRSGGGRDGAWTAGGGSRDGAGQARSDWTVSNGPGSRGVAGSGDAVPAEYRHRVNEYFRRLADEAGDDGPSGN